MLVQLVTGHWQTGTRHLGIDIMANKLYTNMEWLKKRYHLDKKTPQDIAKECGTSVETIYVYLAKFGLRKSKR